MLFTSTAIQAEESGDGSEPDESGDGGDPEGSGDDGGDPEGSGDDGSDPDESGDGGDPEGSDPEPEVETEPESNNDEPEPEPEPEVMGAAIVVPEVDPPGLSAIARRTVGLRKAIMHRANLHNLVRLTLTRIDHTPCRVL